MSGIAVLFHRDRRPVEPPALAAMLEAIPYRGQDGLDGHVFGDVALGHASTIVLPEDAGVVQPIVSPRTGCAIVADVRLDNRDELLTLLRDCPRTVSDAEIILRAYERWGTEAPKRLLGDFAFAIWDPARERIVCARDATAQRPLYYRLDAHTFAAASEIRQLLQDRSVPLIPNEGRILDSLVPYTMMSNVRDRADTYFEGIHCLRAAHTLVVERGSTTIRRYWQIDPGLLQWMREDESDEAFRAVFFEAVRARLRTSRRIGVFLSGGLDSTSVACAAQTLLRTGQAAVPDFVAISATYPGLDCDERPYVEATRDMYGFETRFVETDPQLEALKPLLTGFRESPRLPTGGTTSLFEAAASEGIPVVLTGEVADALMGGSPFMLDQQLRSGRLAAYWRNLRFCQSVGYNARRLVAVHSVLPLLPLSMVRRIAELDERRDHPKMSWRLTPPWMTEGLRTELLRRDLECRVEEQRRRVFRSIGQQMDHSGIEPPEAPMTPAGWPVEIWRPFADRRLWEFMMSVPPARKFDQKAPTAYAASKQVLRRGLGDILPDAIRLRDGKVSFDGTVSKWLTLEWRQVERVLEPGQHARIYARGYVDAMAFWQRLQSLRDGHVDRDLLFVRAMIGLELWLRSLEGHRDAATSVSDRSAVDRQSTAASRARQAAFVNRDRATPLPSLAGSG
jgi:asparagine synthase (glutamine-hydrolysing)